MTTVNDPLGNFYNGSLGYVTKLEDNHIWVQIDDGVECEVLKNVWEIIRYEIEGDPNSEFATFKRTVAGTYLQYPLKLAWAVTVHKSQGQTFSAVNLNPNCWDSGQLYVALSRVQTIEGLHFTRPIYDRYLRLDPAVADFYERAALDEPEDAGVARDMKYESPKPKKETKKESVDFSDKDRVPSMDSDQLSLF